jgi:glycosyltransferase involved in cell wall biosynthesis
MTPSAACRLDQPAGAGDAARAPRRLRLAVVAPVATAVPPRRSGSIESIVSLLVEGLVTRGHDVTLFATADSTTSATLHAVFPRGYCDDPTIWPWELCELFNLSAALERAASFDVVHYHAASSPMALPFGRLSPTPVLQTLHHLPSDSEIALWSRYPEAPFVAVSTAQARRLGGLNVAAIIPHAIDTAAFAFQPVPDDYLLFLGRFTEGKGALQAIEAARRVGGRLVLAAAENEYYREAIAPLVDGDRVVYAGEVDHDARVALMGGARALLYPVQAGEPFGLVLAEAMACGTPVAALDRGAVPELVDEGVTGRVFESLDALVDGLPAVMALDRALVRARARDRFGPDRMIDAYAGVYGRLVASRAARQV